MLKPSLLVLALGLGMASAHSDTRFDGFMQTVVGNKNTVSFGTGGTPIAVSSAPLGTPAIQAMGFTKTAEGVFMESIGSAKVPGTTNVVPLSAKLKLSAAAVAKGLVKGAFAVAAIGSLWSTGNAIYDIWSDAGSGVRPCSDKSKGVLCEVDPNSKLIPTLRYFFSSPNGTSVSEEQYSSLEAICSSHYSAVPVSYYVPTKYKLPFSPSSGNSNPPLGTFTPDIGSCKVQKYSYLGLDAGTDIRVIGVVNRPLNGNEEKPIDEPTAVAKLETKPYWPDPVGEALTQALRNETAQRELADEIEANPNVKPVVTVPGISPGQRIQIGDPVTVDDVTTHQDGSTTTKRSVTVTELVATGNTLETISTIRSEIIQKSPTGQVTSTETKPTVTTAPSTTTSPSTGGENSPLEDLITCGLPETPPCAIKEEGYPEVEQLEQSKIDEALKPLTDFTRDFRSILPEMPSLNWAFTFPSGCSAISLGGGFSKYGGIDSIDICQYQPIIHDIMNGVWAAAGLFAALGLMFREASGS